MSQLGITGLNGTLDCYKMAFFSHHHLEKMTTTNWPSLQTDEMYLDLVSKIAVKKVIALPEQHHLMNTNIAHFPRRSGQYITSNVGLSVMFLRNLRERRSWTLWLAANGLPCHLHKYASTHQIQTVITVWYCRIFQIYAWLVVRKEGITKRLRLFFVRHAQIAYRQHRRWVLPLHLL